MRVWAGFQYPDGIVPIGDVEEWLEAAIRDFHLLGVMVDPYQMEGTIQKFERRVTVERFAARGGKSNYELAVLMQKLITGTQLAWYEDCGKLVVPGRDGADPKVETFKTELLSVQLRPMEYGYRIDNVKAGTHDDRVICAGMAAMLLEQLIPRQMGMCMSVVQRTPVDRNLYGSRRPGVSAEQQMQAQIHRKGIIKPPSAAERRGMYGRGRSGWK